MMRQLLCLCNFACQNPMVVVAFAAFCHSILLHRAFTILCSLVRDFGVMERVGLRLDESHNSLTRCSRGVFSSACPLAAPRPKGSGRVILTPCRLLRFLESFGSPLGVRLLLQPGWNTYAILVVSHLSSKMSFVFRHTLLLLPLSTPAPPSVPYSRLL
ncbi:hypothetical protein M426DRAFT_255863 [Hypoxylon sp. CI-4A]|nr:hypothetical protein M426DRAFT_255863 [Hypoxylon sp. CI-4A]